MFPMRDRFHRARLLAFVTGLVNQELLLRNEYLVAENRILRAHLPLRLRLSDAERSTLAEIAKRLGRKALTEIARVARPDTLLVWYRRLVAQKFDGSQRRAYPGRPRVSPEVRGARGPFRAREPRLGIRPDCGRARQSGPCYLGSNGRQHPAPAQHRSSARAKSHDDVEGVHPVAPGRDGWRRLLHRGVADLARTGDVLRFVLHRSRQSQRVVRRHRTPSGLVLDGAGGS